MLTQIILLPSQFYCNNCLLISKISYYKIKTKRYPNWSKCWQNIRTAHFQKTQNWNSSFVHRHGCLIYCRMKVIRYWSSTWDPCMIFSEDMSTTISQAKIIYQFRVISWLKISLTFKILMNGFRIKYLATKSWNSSISWMPKKRRNTPPEKEVMFS